MTEGLAVDAITMWRRGKSALALLDRAFIDVATGAVDSGGDPEGRALYLLRTRLVVVLTMAAVLPAVRQEAMERGTAVMTSTLPAGVPPATGWAGGDQAGLDMISSMLRGIPGLDPALSERIIDALDDPHLLENTRTTVHEADGMTVVVTTSGTSFGQDDDGRYVVTPIGLEVSPPRRPASGGSRLVTILIALGIAAMAIWILVTIVSEG